MERIRLNSIRSGIYCEYALMLPRGTRHFQRFDRERRLMLSIRAGKRGNKHLCEPVGHINMNFSVHKIGVGDFLHEHHRIVVIVARGEHERDQSLVAVFKSSEFQIHAVGHGTVFGFKNKRFRERWFSGLRGNIAVAPFVADAKSILGDGQEFAIVANVGRLTIYSFFKTAAVFVIYLFDNRAAVGRIGVFYI